MPRQFEVFTGRFKPASNKFMRVTLNARGSFSLNHATYEALGSPKFVELLYDAASGAIGMRAADESNRHAYPVRTQRNAKSYLVGARAFYMHYGLNLEGLTVFNDPQVDEGILILENGQVLTQRAKRNGNGGGVAKVVAQQGLPTT